MHRIWIVSLFICVGCASMRNICYKPVAEITRVDKISRTRVLVYAYSKGAIRTIIRYGTDRAKLDHMEVADVKQGEGIADISGLDPRYHWYMQLRATNACGETVTTTRRLTK
jgi:hypothetical protein